MIGSPVIAAFIAWWAFWILLLVGWIRGELGIKGTLVFMLLWFGGLVGLPYVPYSPAQAMFSPWVALLDIALVFKIFKGDVRLT
jgi:hypothetical protein